jgi:hypothetical protein
MPTGAEWRLGRKVETLIGAQVGGSGVAFDRQEHSLGISAAGVGLPILSAARSLSPFLRRRIVSSGTNRR